MCRLSEPRYRLSLFNGAGSNRLAAYFSIHVRTGSDDGRLRRPLVVMVEPTEGRKPDDVATDLRERPRGCAGRYPLKQPLMRTGTIEVDLNVLPQYTMQLPFAEYYDVVQVKGARLGLFSEKMGLANSRVCPL